jgi:membrane protease YdiL (CAAX protease family)
MKAGALLLPLLVQATLFFVLAELLLRRRGLSLTRLGLGRLTWQQGALGITLGCVLFVLSSGMGSVLDAALQHALSRAAYLRISGSQWAEQAFDRFDSPWQRLVFVLTGAVVAPLGEEALFRGYVYTTLRARRGVSFAIGGSALIFALLHLAPLTAACVIFMMGIALAAVYERTHSLWVVVLMHGVNNTLSFLLLWRRAQ